MSVAIVESEKLPSLPSHFIPDFIWLATGGMNGCFNKSLSKVLGGRDIILFPDLGATDKWKSKLPLLQSICKNSCHNILEDNATEEQKANGLDIADFLLMTENTADGATKTDKEASATPTSDRQSWVGVGGRAITLLAAVITSSLANISLVETNTPSKLSN